MHSSVYIFLLLKLCSARYPIDSYSHFVIAADIENSQDHILLPDATLHSRHYQVADTLQKPSKALLTTRARGSQRRPSPMPPPVEINFPPIPEEWPTNLPFLDVQSSRGIHPVDSQVVQNSIEFTFRGHNQNMHISNLRGHAGLLIRGVDRSSDPFAVAARFTLDDPSPFIQAVQKAMDVSRDERGIYMVQLILPSIGDGGETSRMVAVHLRNEISAIFTHAEYVGYFYPFHRITSETRHVDLYQYSTYSNLRDNSLRRSRYSIRYEAPQPRRSFLACLGNPMACFSPPSSPPD